jgi:hypothetical protein
MDTKSRRYRRGLAARAEIPVDAVWAYRDRLHRTGGHLLWQGAVDQAGTPVLGHGYAKYSVLRIAWLLQYDSAPTGIIRSSCGTKLCVLAAHLTDDASRQEQHLVRAREFGIDMSGTCTAGHLLAVFGTVLRTGRVDCRRCDSLRRRMKRALEKAVA